jgi:hypothetical protein
MISQDAQLTLLNHTTESKQKLDFIQVSDLKLSVKRVLETALVPLKSMCNLSVALFQPATPSLTNDALQSSK